MSATQNLLRTDLDTCMQMPCHSHKDDVCESVQLHPISFMIAIRNGR